MNRPDLRGQAFGHLTVTGFAGIHNKQAAWYCDCSCGAKRVVGEYNLKRGIAQSCGHTRSKGGTVNGKRTPEYTAWENMISRCERPSAINFDNYGERGIAVCERWRRGVPGATGFECFVADMGTKLSSKHSLDRIDTEKGYAPENCRWATRKEQAWNRRTTRWVIVEGKKIPFEECFKLLKVKRTLFFALTKNKTPVLEALKVAARVKLDVALP